MSNYEANRAFLMLIHLLLFDCDRKVMRKSKPN